MDPWLDYLRLGDGAGEDPLNFSDKPPTAATRSDLMPLLQTMHSVPLAPNRWKVAGNAFRCPSWSRPPTLLAKRTRSAMLQGLHGNQIIKLINPHLLTYRVVVRGQFTMACPFASQSHILPHSCQCCVTPNLCYTMHSLSFPYSNDFLMTLGAIESSHSGDYS